LTARVAAPDVEVRARVGRRGAGPREAPAAAEIVRGRDARAELRPLPVARLVRDSPDGRRLAERGLGALAIQPHVLGRVLADRRGRALAAQIEPVRAVGREQIVRRVTHLRPPDVAGAAGAADPDAEAVMERADAEADAGRTRERHRAMNRTALE